METNINKAVAYLDILGFKNIVRIDIRSAFQQLWAINSMLNNRFTDYITYQSQPPLTDPDLIDLQKRTLFDGVTFYFPYSDSIFASSDKCDLFVQQLSNLIYELYDYSINNGFEFPILYKGGISYGEATRQPMHIIQGGNVSKVYNIIGEAVIDAVSLESYTYTDNCGQCRKLKGPRLLLSKELYGQLTETKDYCIPVKESNGTLYEVLWPDYAYIKQKLPFQNIQEFSEHFYKMFDNAYRLWKKYKKEDNVLKRNGDDRISLHYEELIKLIISSTTIYFMRKNNLQNTVDLEMTKYINSKKDDELKEICNFQIHL